MPDAAKPDRRTVIELLRIAVLTASNDDVTELGTQARARHAQRIEAMEAAVEVLEDGERT